jgi:hypothetical protein
VEKDLDYPNLFLIFDSSLKPNIMSHTCPKCESKKVRSFDNQPLHHADKSEIEAQPLPTEESYQYMGFDSELYVSFVCDDCKHEFQKVFTLVEKK